MVVASINNVFSKVIETCGDSVKVNRIEVRSTKWVLHHWASYSVGMTVRFSLWPEAGWNGWQKGYVWRGVGHGLDPLRITTKWKGNCVPKHCAVIHSSLDFDCRETGLSFTLLLMVVAIVNLLSARGIVDLTATSGLVVTMFGFQASV